MKFTDEQLSRILSEHAGRKLVRSGRSWYPFQLFVKSRAGCINQAAYNIDDSDTAEKRNIEAAKWFDNNYDNKWSPAEFLKQIDKNVK